MTTPSPHDDPDAAPADTPAPAGRRASGFGVVMVLAALAVGLSGFLPFVATESEGERGDIGGFEAYTFEVRGVDLGSVWLGGVPFGQVMLAFAGVVLVAGVVVALTPKRWFALLASVVVMAAGVGAVAFALFERSEVTSQLERFTATMTAALASQSLGRATVGSGLEVAPAAGFALAVIGSLVAVGAAIAAIVVLTRPSSSLLVDLDVDPGVDPDGNGVR